MPRKSQHLFVADPTHPKACRYCGRTIQAHDMLPVKPAIVSAQYGTVVIADCHDDPGLAVMEHFENGAGAITVEYLEVVS